MSISSNIFIRAVVNYAKLNNVILITLKISLPEKLVKMLMFCEYVYTAY